MAQLHLVLHYTSPVDGQTYYEANATAAYDLVRYGKTIELVCRRLGNDAASVMMHLLFLGHARVSELEKATHPWTGDSALQPRVQGSKPNGKLASASNVTNGHHAGEIGEQPGELHYTLLLLADQNLICHVREAHVRSEVDNRAEVERLVRANPGTEKKAKAREAEIEQKIEQTLEEWYDGTVSKAAFTTRLTNGTKRKAEDDVPTASIKKARPENHLRPPGPVAEERISEMTSVPISPNLVVRANFSRIAVLLRNERFIAMAEHDLGRTTSQVYRALLDHVESIFDRPPSSHGLASETALGPAIGVSSVSARQILTSIDGKVKTSEGLAHVHAAKLDKARLRKRLVKREEAPSATVGLGSPVEGTLEPDIDGEDDDAENYGVPRANGDAAIVEGEDIVTHQRADQPLADVEDHLLLLAQSPHGFAIPTTEFNNARWTVSPPHVSTNVQHVELFRMIKARFGPHALRLVRILESKGRLDEKRLQDLALLTAKDCRMQLENLNRAGFLELQEVPRDSHRQPGRTMYLWFYDADRVRKVVLEDTYKAMARCLQRMKVEREKHRGVLENAARTDISGREEELLPREELKSLKLWRKKEERLLAEVGRLDELVSVFRDG